jgi:peptidoglycan/LPS O-acetylase OafA/YrhL
MPLAQKNLTYRADLDGLRAIAVLSVVIYHVWHRVLLGGFLGVDVFFVLSGFLITSIIWQEAQARQFSIKRFYERRIRRIMPALLLVLFVATIVATAILLPADLIGYCRSLVATLTFVANIYFWRDTSYFSPSAETKPLLHTWSLGVEEQFYIFFPLLLVLLVRLAPRLTIYVIALTTVASLVLNIFLNHVGGGSPAFFLLPTRAWELGFGAIVALLPNRMIVPAKLATILSWIGFMLMMIGLVEPISLTDDIPVALPIVIGVTLLVVVGRHTQPKVNRALSYGPMVFIGLISYSLYLWHWPVIVLANYYFVNGTPAYVVALEIVAIGLCAYGSWRFVERPFRDRQMPVGRVVRLSGASALALAGVAALTLFFQGLPDRLNAQAAMINEAVDTHYRCPSSQYLNLGLNRACPMNLPSRNPADAEAVLLGNSIAQMYAPAWTAVFAEHHTPGLLVPANGCLPTVIVNYALPGCAVLAKENLANVLALPRVRLVILAFTWSAPDPLRDTTGKIVDDDALVDGIDDLVNRLRQAGKQVILVGPIARPGWHVASTISRELAFGWPIRRTGMAVGRFEETFNAAISHFEASHDITFVPVHTALCDTKSCAYVIDARSVYSDDTHISENELWRFSALFKAAFTTAWRGF